MIVREVRLENIKSYGSPAEVIRLTRGVNAICGSNGAGKSTVLEAIGCALFQHLPYRHEEFVRSGETSGTITVVVESRRDGRTYEIVRKVGRGGSHYIYDPDLQQQIARGDASVGHWLRQHLDLDEMVDLRSLFTDAVGPPQGTLTAVFLDSPQVRRAKFDRLLRVDEYAEAFRRLSVLETALKEEQETYAKEVASLDGQLAIRPDRELRYQIVRADQADLALRLSRGVAERSSLDRLLAAFEQAEAAWQAAKSTREVAALRAQHTRDLRDAAVRDHATAQAAAETCSRTRAAHDAYREADAQLRALDQERRLRDGLLVKRQGLSLKAARDEAALARIDSDIRRLEEALAEAADLEGRVPEQEAAEERLQRASSARQKAIQLQVDLVSLKQSLEEIEEGGKWIQKEVNRIIGLQPLAAELASRQARYEEASRALATANRADGELGTLRRIVQRDRQQLGILQEKLTELSRLISVARALDPPPEAPAVLEARLRAATEGRAGATAQLKHARATRLQVNGGLCPFFHEECRNLRPGVDLAIHFDHEIVRWSDEVERLTREYADAERAIDQARSYAEQQSKVAEWTRQHEGYVRDAEVVRGHLAEGEQRLKDAAALASSRTEIERQAHEAQDALQAAVSADEEVRRLPGRQTELRARREAWQRQKAKIEETRGQIAELGGAEAEFHAATEDLRAMGNPREGAARRRAEAEPLPLRRAERERTVTALERYKEGLSEIDRQFRPFADLDARTEALHRRREGARPDYEAYVSAAVLASTVEQRAAQLAGAESAWQQAEAARATAEQALAAAVAGYDGEAHRAHQQRRAKIDQAIGETQASIAAALDEEQRLRDDLTRLDALKAQRDDLEARMAGIEEEKQAAGVIRQAIRAAGPEITKRLLLGISRTASQINAEIINQAGLEIEWSPTFEIITRRQGEERSFGQLSGGEQMAAALAVRLALLRELSNVRVAFLDEPTAHLDAERRSNLGDQVQRLRGFDQIVVISHDDTFDGLFGHVIRIGRERDRSRVVAQE